VCGVPVVACDNRFWLYTWTVRTKFSQCFLLPGCKRRECDLRQGCFVVFRSEELKGCWDIGLMIVLGSVLFFSALLLRCIWRFGFGPFFRPKLPSGTKIGNTTLGRCSIAQWNSFTSHEVG